MDRGMRERRVNFMKKNLKKVTALLGAAVLITSIIAGCGNTAGNADSAPAASEEETAAAAAEEPSVEVTVEEEEHTEGGGTIEGSSLSFGIEETITNLDSTLIDLPDDWNISWSLQDNLYEVIENETRLQLAESVDVNEDETVYTFHLRDAQYSNGDPIVASDFVYSWQRLVDPETGSPNVWHFSTAGVKNVDAIAYEGADIDSLGVEAPDDKTLIVTLSRPVPFLSSILALPPFAPLDRKFVEEQGENYGKSADALVSSGAYVIDEWIPGSNQVKLKKNDNYWNADEVRTEHITFKTVEDVQSGVLSFEAGDLDVLKVDGDVAEQYAGDSRLVTALRPKMLFLYLNNKNEFLSNKNIRLALQYAVNKKEFAEKIRKNVDRPADYFIPDNFAYNDKGESYRDQVSLTYYSYDTDKAVEAWNKGLEELGVSEVKLDFLYDDTTSSKNAVQYFKSELESLLPGLTLELREVGYAACWEEQKGRNFDVTYSSWEAEYLDPAIYFDFMESSSEYNLGSFENSEYDKYIAQSRDDYATDPVKRVEAFGNAEQIILDEVGIIPIYQEGRSNLESDGVVLHSAATGQPLYRYAYIEQ